MVVVVVVVVGRTTEARPPDRETERQTDSERMGDYRQSTEYRKDAEALLAPAGRPAPGGGWLSELSAPQRRVFLQHLAVQVGHSSRHCSPHSFKPDPLSSRRCCGSASGA